MKLDIEPIGYLEIKRGIEALKQEIETLGNILQINLLSLDMLEKELEKYPVPELPLLKEAK